VKPSNESVIAALRQLVAYTQLEDGKSQSFRTRAYEKAIDAISGQSADVADMSLAELKSIEGVGDSTARKITEFATNGSIGKVDRLKQQFPPTMLDLMKIPGLGPKTVLMLQEHLDVVDVAGLEQAIADERLRDLPGLGQKSEEKIASAIELLGIHSDETRTPIFEAMQIARRVMADLDRTGLVGRMEYAGSLRRLSETIGDIDILATADDPSGLMGAFGTLGGVTATLGSGSTKASVVFDDRIQVDLRVVPEENWGAALMYFTGSKGHNIELRQRALDRGWTLNEYSLSSLEDRSVVASRTESEIYTALELPWITPEVREGTGEIAAAADGGLPEPILVETIRGDLHVHTDMSGDGKSSLDDMLSANVDRGMDYVAITDHAEDLALNGLSRERMLEGRAAIEEARDRFPDLLILHGAELNIDPDGGIDYDPEFLEGFDFGVASVHSHFDLEADAQTTRLVAAIRNPAVNVIGHLTGRRIGMRPGIRFDLDSVLAAASETGTALEINASLQRLDMSAANLRAAVAIDGVMFAVSTDAHHTVELGNMRWGVALARKGWVPKSRIVNSLTKTEFMAWTARKRDTTQR
jgi:DNA polymerase (family 10)